MHHLRLGAEGGKINVLGRKAGVPGHLRGLACLLLCLAMPLSLAGMDDPLAWCWDRVSTRPELAPCLEELLREAQARLAAKGAAVERGAAELDRVTGGRYDNVGRVRESDARWREYRDAECARQSAAMSPGTGSGDVLLACRVTLTNARIRQLGKP